MARLTLIALSLLATHVTWGQQGPLSPEDLTAIRSVVGTATPQWSPDGARIMFASPLGGSDLWTIPSTGGFPVPLNVDMGEIAFLQGHQPTFSPDGKWIAYISNKTGAAEMFVTSLDDGRAVQLTRLGARINSYSWSPDSRSIAVADDRSGGFDIYVVAVPDGHITRITTDPRYDVFPSWTPDGKHVVYVAGSRDSGRGSRWDVPIRCQRHRLLRLRRGGHVRVSADLAGWLYDTISLAAKRLDQLLDCSPLRRRATSAIPRAGQPEWRSLGA
jgi:WD40 repeat protein